jgi:hypothetical protein
LPLTILRALPILGPLISDLTSWLLMRAIRIVLSLAVLTALLMAALLPALLLTTTRCFFVPRLLVLAGVAGLLVSRLFVFDLWARLRFFRLMSLRATALLILGPARFAFCLSLR